MPCLHPLLIHNKRYKDASPAVLRWYADEYFEGGHFVKGLPDDYKIPVPCGVCSQCLKVRRRAFALRGLWQFRNYPLNPRKNPYIKSVFFITLTFSDDYLNNPTFNPRKAVSKFLDVLRKKYCDNKRIKHFIVGEYGENSTKRLHYHGLLWDLSYSQIPFSEFWKLWKYGRCDIQYVRNIQRSVLYLVKYLLKYEKPEQRKFTRVLVSRGFGLDYIGSDACERDYSLDLYCSSYNGIKYPLHRYYTSRMYDVLDKLRQSRQRLLNPPDEYYLNGFRFKDIVQYRAYFEETVRKELLDNPIFYNKFHYYYG